MKNRFVVSSRFVIVALIVGLSLAASSSGFAAAPGSEGRQQGDPEVRTATHDQTGKLSFLGADPASPIVVQGALEEGLAAQDRGMAVLSVYGTEFGLKDPGQELTVMRVNTQEDGRPSVRYQQVYEGVPVVAGELIVNTDIGGQLLSISGEISPDLSLSTTPVLTADEASAIARAGVAKWYGLDEGAIESTDPELWIYDERLLLWSERPQVLVWRMDVSPAYLSAIKELVLINAETGGISLHFNQIDTALDRLGDACDPDDDNDGVLDDADCDPLDPGLQSPPGAVIDLMLSDVAGLTTLSWSPPAVPGATTITYDTLASIAASDFSIPSCVEAGDGSDTQALHGVVPGSGAAYYYLIRVNNGCGSRIGPDSDDVERLAGNC